MSLFRDESMSHEEMVEIESRLTKLESSLTASREMLEKWRAQVNLIKKLLGDLELSIRESRKESFMMDFGSLNRDVNLSESLEKEDIEDES
ncbi:MAG TPA: hypothetical protein VNM22_12870 [Candidatus Limnocylindrales bacterium]|nr:hypothetical protein [Candidatus Limnocylindrales bacterium]